MNEDHLNLNEFNYTCALDVFREKVKADELERLIVAANDEFVSNHTTLFQDICNHYKKLEEKETIITELQSKHDYTLKKLYKQ